MPEGRSGPAGRALETPTRPGTGPQARSADGLFAVTLTDYYRDSQRKEDAVLRRIAEAEGLPQVLGALGFTLPREAYFPSPAQSAHRVLKTLRVPAKPLATQDPDQTLNSSDQKDCSVRYCATRSCWLYVRDLLVRPLNLTSAESLVLRWSLHCGVDRAWIDFCEIVSQASETPGQYTPPQVILVPNTGCLVLDIFNEDQHSEAWFALSSFQWLVPPDAEDHVARRGIATKGAGR